MGNSNNSIMASNNAINTGGANTVEFPMGSYEAMETRTNRRNISFIRRRGDAPDSDDFSHVRVAALKKIIMNDAQYEVHKKYADFERMAMKFKHPNIVVYYGFESQQMLPDCRLTFVMEKCNASLKYVAHQRRWGVMDLAETCYLLFPICEALAALHAKGVVHRDIKPDNILLLVDDIPDRRNLSDDEWQQVRLALERIKPKLCDFGLSRYLDLANPMTGKLGTVGYMAPELMGSNRVSYTAKVDVYSMGIVYLELLSGSKSFTAGEDLTPRLPHIDPDVIALLTRMLKTNPAERPTMAEVVTEVKKLMPVHEQWQNIAIEEEEQVLELGDVVVVNAA